MKLHSYQGSRSELEILFIGPPLEEGPLPALFYFALSAKDSLQKDPFNQPVQFLVDFPLRVFSITLPAHENNLPPENAIHVWAKKMNHGENILSTFINQVSQEISDLSPYIAKGKWGVAGLSRGAFIACHVAAKCPEVTHILGFAPLTRLTHNKEFSGEEAESLALEALVPKIYNRKIRFYIGNHDTRVGTEHAFSFIHALAEEAHKHRIRSSPIELIIRPSIGYQGHGTSFDTFKDGAKWIRGDFIE